MFEHSYILCVHPMHSLPHLIHSCACLCGRAYQRVRALCSLGQRPYSETDTTAEPDKAQSPARARDDDLMIDEGIYPLSLFDDAEYEQVFELRSPDGAQFVTGAEVSLPSHWQSDVLRYAAAAALSFCVSLDLSH